jgi:hypothetical protein
MVSLPYALFIIFDDKRSLDTFASLVIPVYRAYQRGEGVRRTDSSGSQVQRMSTFVLNFKLYKQ